MKLPIIRQGLLVFILLPLLACSPPTKSKNKTPNILIAIADDQSYPHASIYGTKWLSTTGFDRIANEGLLFNHAYTTNAKCSPSRSTI